MRSPEYEKLIMYCHFSMAERSVVTKSDGTWHFMRGLLLAR